MYVLRFGQPFRVSHSIDTALLEKYNQLHPEKKIQFGQEALACVFHDQEFISFLKNELDNGYELQSNSVIEIIEYDETKGHPILVELTGEDDANLFDFENGILWSNEPGSPEYRSLCKGYYYIYDRNYIDSLKTHRVDYMDLEREICSTESIYQVEGYTYQELKSFLGEAYYAIKTPEDFSKVLSLAQSQLGEVNTSDIIRSSAYIEGMGKKNEKAAQMLLAKQAEDEIKKYCAEIDPKTQYISFGQSADTFNSGTIPPIKNDPNVKPTGGIWACTYSPIPFKHSAWEEYCRDEDEPFHVNDGYLDKGFKFTLSKTARLFKIDTKEDFEYLQKNFGKTMLRSSIIDFEKLSKIVDGIMITENGQYLLDFYEHINPTSKFMIKPFCVPGITVFTQSIIENVQDFDHILENQIQNEVQEISQISSAGHNISATQIGTELEEISRSGLVFECERDLIALAKEKNLALDEEHQEKQ